MTNKNTIIATILIIMAIILIGLGIAIAFKDINYNSKNTEYDLNRLYIISSNNAYGVTTADGQILIQPQFSKIARINDILYLKSNNSSYLYNLSTKETITLDGVESDIIYIYDNTKLMDKFILQYGNSSSDAIYRIIDSNGEKVTNKDFANIDAIYDFLNITTYTNFTPKSVKSTSLNESAIHSTLTYPTQNLKSQYITKENINGTTKYGIVDEDGNQIVKPTFDKIEQQKNSDNICVATKDSISYIVLDNGNLIQIEQGFEFDYNKEGYIIQKRGSTGNKIYNLNGDIIVDKIFTYPTNIAILNGETAKYLLMQDEKTNLWSIYDVNTSEKLKMEFSNLVSDYLLEQDANTINTSFIYKTSTSTIGVDLKDFSTFNIRSSYYIISPLESGMKLEITQ